MHHVPAYILLFIVLSLVQIFLLNNLVVGSFLCPLIYIAFIILMRLDTMPIVMLGCSLAMGMVMDMTMGVAGINTIATLLIGFLRPSLIRLVSTREDLREDGIPSPERMGTTLFWSYLVVMVLLHHTVFFSLEALSWGFFLRTVGRILLSSFATLLLVWLTMRLFTAKISARA